jgi:hypothetical protein
MVVKQIELTFLVKIQYRVLASIDSGQRYLDTFNLPNIFHIKLQI